MNATPVQLTYFLLPVILGGICNMLYLRLPWVQRWNAPMDGGRLDRDGKRLLGDHKTWQGFFGMIVLTALWMTFFVFIDSRFDWAHRLAVVNYRPWRFPLQALMNGGLLGFGYVLLELPNSYIKRRIDIAPGKNARGGIGLLFLFLDQADSVAGCLLLMLVFFRPRPAEVLTIFIIGVGIHYIVNILLYMVGLKKQAG